MELKGTIVAGKYGWLRRGLRLFKCGDQKKKNGRCMMQRVLDLEGMVEKGKSSSGGVGGVVSWAEEEGGVVRMKIVVKKSDLKHLVGVMSIGVIKGVAAAHRRPTTTTAATMSNVIVNANVPSSASTAEQRLNHLLWKKHHVSSIAKQLKGNRHKCWSPALQSIPEEI